MSSVDEVILTLNDSAYTSGTALNIQTGVYAGGGPATVEGSATLTLPATFISDAGITVLLNGQEIKKGTDVTRISATKVALSIDLDTDDQIKIRIIS